MIILPDFRIHQRDYLLKISRAITVQLDLNVVLRMVLEASVSMLSGEIGLIALRGPHNHLAIQAVLGIEPDQIDVFDPLLELANMDEAEIEPDDVRMRVRLISRKLDMNLRQVVSLPMQISGESLGIIYVFRAYPGNPTPDDHKILESFADQAAIAVHNAGLYQAIIAEKQRLSTILDGSADGIMILDANLRIMRINPALARMTGWKAEYALGRLHEDIIRWAEPVPSQLLETMVLSKWVNHSENTVVDDEKSSIDIQNSFYVEGELERLDGITLSVEIKYAPVFFEDGNLRNIIANVRDITHYREAEEMKTTFISVISHELKTPVALIKGYAGTLRRDDAKWDAATIQRSLTIIEEEADRLTGLIEDLLTASRLQVEGVMQLDLDDVALNRIAEKAIERFQTQTSIHTFELKFEEDFPIITGDAHRLRHVFDNLISNAIKYSPQGGKIIIGGRSRDHQQVQVYIKDEGIGLSEEDAIHVFDRFFRADDSLTRSAPGTGLGLYLVKAIIDAHQGKIWVTSHHDGKGTTFSFTLPCTLENTR